LKRWSELVAKTNRPARFAVLARQVKNRRRSEWEFEDQAGTSGNERRKLERDAELRRARKTKNEHLAMRRKSMSEGKMDLEQNHEHHKIRSNKQ
jgi:hypothetical protein